MPENAAPKGVTLTTAIIDAALRIEMPGGDLHQMCLNGELLDLDRAREVPTTEVTA
jgi:hypothetical protein